jgi:triacylglycerol lipase
MAARARGTVQAGWSGVQAISTLREIARVRADLMPVVPNAIAGDDVVVLVHGFLATAGIFRPLRARLEREAGARIASFSHAPGLGVKRIAQQLSGIVDRIPTGTRIHLVGHSLGGLVARWYVQEGGGHARIAQTIAIATPFGGAKLAERCKLFVGNDLHAGSDVLARLRDGSSGTPQVPHLSIAGTADRVVSPVSARFGASEIAVLEGRGHNQLLFDREAIDLVVSRVRRSRLT